MAAPNVASKGTVAAVTSGSITHTLPASLVANDIVILAVECWLPATVGDAAVIPTPTATNITFALIGSQIATPAVTIDGRIAFFWGRCTGTPGSVTITRGASWDTGTDGQFACQSWRVTGCRTVGNPWDDAQVSSASQSTTVTYTAVSVNNVERTLFAIQAIQDNVATATPPTNYSIVTSEDNSGTGTDSGFAGYQRTNQSSDGQVTNTVSALAQGYWGSLHLSLVPTLEQLIATSTGASTTPTEVLAGAGAVVGSSTGVDSTSSTLAGMGAIVASSAGVAASTADGLATIQGIASSTGGATGAGTIAGTGAVIASGAGLDTTTATLAGAGAVAATSTGASTTSSALAGTGSVSATGTGNVTSSSVLTGSGALTGSSPSVAAGSANLTGTGTAVASSAGLSTTIASLAGTGNVIAISTGLDTTSAALIGTGALSASSPGVATGDGTLHDDSSGVSDIAGASSGISSTASVLDGTGQVVGSSNGQSTLNSVLTGEGFIQALAAGQSTLSAILSGLGALVGGASGGSTVQGTFGGNIGTVGSLTVQQPTGTHLDLSLGRQTIEVQDGMMAAITLVDLPGSSISVAKAERTLEVA